MAGSNPHVEYMPVVHVVPTPHVEFEEGSAERRMLFVGGAVGVGSIALYGTEKLAAAFFKFPDAFDQFVNKANIGVMVGSIASMGGGIIPGKLRRENGS